MQTSRDKLVKDIPGYEGLYTIDTDGNIFGLKSGKYLSTPENLRGYKRVGLYREGKGRWFEVHRLVLITFVGLPREKLVACHNNGIKTDNRLENLRWDTCTGNQKDRLEHGTHARGEKHPLAKLTESDVRDIRWLRSMGVLLRELAEMYNMSSSHIGSIARGTFWNYAE